MRSDLQQPGRERSLAAGERAGPQDGGSVIEGYFSGRNCATSGDCCAKGYRLPQGDAIGRNQERNARERGRRNRNTTLQRSDYTATLSSRFGVDIPGSLERRFESQRKGHGQRIPGG